MKNISLFILLVLAFQLNAQNSFKQNKSMGFIENKGQLTDQHGNRNNAVKFLLNLNGLKVQLRNGGFSYDTYTTEIKGKELPTIQSHGAGFFKHELFQETISKFHRVDVNFLNTNPKPEIIAENQIESNYNYFISATPETGIKGVKTYGKITYRNIYPGIDLEFVAGTNKKKPVEYNFIVHPGADASLIKWKYEGSDDIALESEQILIRTSNGTLTESIPLTYEKETGQTALASYKIFKSGDFGFDLGKYNKSKTLIIDPVPFVDWCTYYGGEGYDDLYTVKTDDSGYVYVAGQTDSKNNIATTGAYQASLKGSDDVMLAKFSGNGKRIWSTYYGGPGSDGPNDLIIGKMGNLYISGISNSISGIADSGAFQTRMNFNALTGSYDAFVAMFDNNGQWKWGTYFGGEGEEEGGVITQDEDGNIYLIGGTDSKTKIAFGNSHQDTIGSKNTDGFLVKFDDSCRNVIWSTYYGGKGSELPYDLYYHKKNNNLYFAGSSNSSSNIATLGTYKSANTSDGEEGFFVSFDTSGKRNWGSYYGGPSSDYIMDISVDDTNNIYLLGITQSVKNIATTGAHQAQNAGERDCFLVKIDSNFGRIWGTYYGGEGNDGQGRMYLNDSGDIYMAISTRSYRTGINMTTPESPKPVGDPSQWETVISKFSNDGILKWGTYYGTDNYYDNVSNITIDNYGNIYVVGSTKSESKFATSGAHQEHYNGISDGYILRLSENCNNYGIEAQKFQDVTCYGFEDGKAAVKLINALQLQKYQWSNGDITNEIDSLSAGWYKVTVTDSRGCSMQDSIEIKEPVQLTIGALNGKTTVNKGETENYSIPSQAGVSYRWDVTNGTIQSGQGTNGISVQWGNDNAGEVKALIYTFEYCGDSSIINVILEDVNSTGVGHSKAKGFRVYPNPASESININLTDGNLVNSEYLITDNMGRIIEKGTLQTETRIYLRNFAPGVYFLSTGTYKTKIMVVK